MLANLVRLFIAAAVAVTTGFTWTVGQSGLHQTNTNLCDLWKSLPLPAYPSCEFQYILPIAWGIAFCLAVLWACVELFRIVRAATNRRHRLLSYSLLSAFFIIGALVSVSFLVAEYRKPQAIAAAVPVEPIKEETEAGPAAAPAAQQAPQQISPLSNETLLGFSAQLNVEIRNVAELRRQYIFQHVTPENAKAEFYFSANDQFVFSITDIRGETNSLELHIGSDGVPIYRRVFLVCEAGIKANDTYMRVLVDGVEVASRTIPRRIDLGSRNWTKATMGADIKGKQNSAFVVSTWSFGHVTLTNQQIASMNNAMQTYLKAVTNGK